MNSRLSFINNYNTLAEALKDIGITHSRIKKNNLSKKKLTKNIRSQNEITLPIDLLNHLEINPLYLGPDPEIIFENELFLAFNKPSGVHCHPLHYSESDNILSYMRSIKRYSDLRVRSDYYDRGLLYRLDYETSGVLFYVKDESALLSLRERFRSLVKTKKYIAIVKGRPGVCGSIELYFKSSGKKGSKQLVFDKEGPSTLRGELNLKELAYIKKLDCSCVEIALVTGIRHQIRATLSYIGNPIIGDTFYGGEKEKRVYLHAKEYSFEYLGETFKGIADTAPLFENFLDLNCCL